MDLSADDFEMLEHVDWDLVNESLHVGDNDADIVVDSSVSAECALFSKSSTTIPSPSPLNAFNINSPELGPYFDTAKDDQYLVLVVPDGNAVIDTNTVVATINTSGKKPVISSLPAPTTTVLQQRNKRRKTPKNESNNDNVKKRKKVNVRKGIIPNFVTDNQTTSQVPPKNPVKLDFENALKDSSSIGIPLIPKNVMKVVRASSFRQNRLNRYGCLKYTISDFKPVSEKWLSDYKMTKNGKGITERSIGISYQEVFKLQTGVFYIRHVYYPAEQEDGTPHCIEEFKMLDINDACKKVFGSPDDDPDAFLHNFFNLLESMPEDPKCEGQGFMMPYFTENKHIDMDKDIIRTGLRMDEMDSPLIEVCRNSLKSRKQIAGVTTPINTLGFTGSPITPTSLNQGPALGLLHQIKFGGDKTWLISPPRFMEKIQEQVASVLQEKLLGSSHPLMQYPLKCVLNHASILLGPEFYTQHKIPYKFVTQKAGEILMLASRTVYSGINMGMNGSEQVTVVGPDFHVTYNEGQAINQCKCEIGTPKSQGIKTSNPGPKFTLNPEEIQVLLKKSEEWVKESRSNHKHLIVSNTRKPQKERPRDQLCEYCGAGFVYPTTRDKHEQRKNCMIYGKCKIPTCKKNAKIFTSIDMKKHIKNNHSDQLKRIEKLERIAEEEAEARIAIRSEKEQAAKMKNENAKKRKNPVVHLNVQSEITLSNAEASVRRNETANESRNLLSYSDIRDLSKSSCTLSQILNPELSPSKMLTRNVGTLKSFRVDLPTGEQLNIPFNDPTQSNNIMSNIATSETSSSHSINFHSIIEGSPSTNRDVNANKREMGRKFDNLINEFLASPELPDTTALEKYVTEN